MPSAMPTAIAMTFLSRFSELDLDDIAAVDLEGLTIKDASTTSGATSTRRRRRAWGCPMRAQAQRRPA